MRETGPRFRDPRQNRRRRQIARRSGRQIHPQSLRRIRRRRSPAAEGTGGGGRSRRHRARAPGRSGDDPHRARDGCRSRRLAADPGPPRRRPRNGEGARRGAQGQRVRLDPARENGDRRLQPSGRSDGGRAPRPAVRSDGRSPRDRSGQGDGGTGDRRRRRGRGVFAAGRAHHRQGTERAALSRAQRHHGGEKEAAREQTHHARAGSARDRLAHPAPGATGRQDRRRGVRSRRGAGASAARGSKSSVSNVLAVLEQRDGALRKVSHEVVTGARRLADAGSGSVEALVLGGGTVSGADQLGRFGADRVTTATHAALGRYTPEGYTRVVVERVRARQYDAVVFPASATGRDLAPRVAARLGVPLAADVTDLGIEGGAIWATRPVYAGKALLKVRFVAPPALLSLRPNVFTPVERPRAGVVETASVDVPERGGRVVVREIKAAAAGALDVAEAPIVVSG